MFGCVDFGLRYFERLYFYGQYRKFMTKNSGLFFEVLTSIKLSPKQPRGICKVFVEDTMFTISGVVFNTGKFSWLQQQWHQTFTATLQETCNKVSSWWKGRNQTKLWLHFRKKEDTRSNVSKLLFQVKVVKPATWSEIPGMLCIQHCMHKLHYFQTGQHQG